jgi:penicillin V acylase-like amidase (Ntn superfamily)
MAVACVFSMVRAIGVPLGMEDPEHPNISATLWRTVGDHDAKRYYFESTIQPAIFWVDLTNLDFSEGSSPRSIEINSRKQLAGEVSGAFEPTEPHQSAPCQVTSTKISSADALVL